MANFNTCFICNIADLPTSECINIFDDNVVLDSGAKLFEAVSQILGNEVDPLQCHSTIICNKCFQTCQEYDSINKRLFKIKNKITTQVQNAHSSVLGTYNSDEKKGDEPNKTIPKNKSPMKTIVLPKSKMIPLSNFVLGGNSNVTQQSSSDQMTHGFLSPNKMYHSVSLLVKPNSMAVSPTKPVSVLHTNVTTNRCASNENESLGKYLVLEATSRKHVADIKQVCVAPSKTNFSTRNEVPEKKSNKGELIIDTSTQSDEYDLSPTASTSNQDDDLSQTKGSEYIISDLEIVTEDHADYNDADTILMDESGNILRVLSGDQRKLLSQVNEISLVSPEEGSQCSEELQLEQLIEEDSNDESVDGVKNEEGSENGEESVSSECADQGTSDPEARILVEQTKDGFKCLVCDNIAKSIEVANSEEEENVKLMTRECDDENMYLSSTDIVVHMKSAHHLRLYVCNLCGASYRKRLCYERHAAQHAESENNLRRKILNDKANANTPKHLYKCDNCSKKFPSQKLLDDHQNIHKGIRPYHCKICDKGYANKYTYNSHLKTHTDRPRPFRCSHCSKSFYTLPNKLAHEKTHDAARDFICKDCGKTFSTQRSLDNHSLIHDKVKPFACGVCNKTFLRRCEIENHLRTHTGERPFECDMCDKRFAQKSNLQTHKRTTHLNERRYECSECHRKFKRKRLLVYHINAAHTHKRPYQCEICLSNFVYPEHYKKHMLIHRNEKPYSCEVCNRAFTSRDNRNAHRFIHSVKKPYECVTCGAGFMRKPQLYSHMTSQGHLSDMIVINQAQVAVKLPDGKSQSDSAKSSASNLSSSAQSEPETEELDMMVEVELTELLDKKNQHRAAVDAKSDTNEEESEEPANVEVVAEPVTEEGEMIESADVTELLARGSEVVTTDDQGNMMHFLQIQLDNGKTEWVAINA